MYVLTRDIDPEPEDERELLYFSTLRARQAQIDAWCATQSVKRLGLTYEIWQLFPQPNGQMSEAGFDRVTVRPTAKRRQRTMEEAEEDRQAEILYYEQLFGAAGMGRSASGAVWTPPTRWEDE